jgi:hypothetical protein
VNSKGKCRKQETRTGERVKGGKGERGKGGKGEREKGRKGERKLCAGLKEKDH